MFDDLNFKVCPIHANSTIHTKIIVSFETEILQLSPAHTLCLHSYYSLLCKIVYFHQVIYTEHYRTLTDFVYCNDLSSTVGSLIPSHFFHGERAMV